MNEVTAEWVAKAVAVRYPGTNVSLELAELAFDAAERVRAFVRTKLGIE